MAFLRLQRWCVPILRVLLWTVALGYLLLEAREVASQRQLTQITILAVLFLVANFQINLARALPPDHHASNSLLQASLIMFLASLFSVLDGALDHLFFALGGGVPGVLLPAIFLLGWAGNLLCVGLALGSMELFFRSLSRFATDR
ncbi:MAG: hypothetical protein ACKOOH_01300 [Cyanobium sp.]